MQASSQPTTISDEELARQAQQGRAEAFEELVRRYQVPLVRFLHRFASVEEAEDLTQDTFVRAYENLHRFRDTWKFATWLFTIARRISLNRNRRRRPEADSEAVEAAESTAALPSEIVGKEEDRRRLWEQAATVLSTSQMTTLCCTTSRRCRSRRWPMCWAKRTWR
jgi:RNA polymerase sigma-70 factor (ECF subfamily)